MSGGGEYRGIICRKWKANISWNFTADGRYICGVSYGSVHQHSDMKVVKLYCRTLYFGLREERRLREFENRALRTIFGPKRNDVDCVWNVMAHAQKPDFAFLRNGRVHLNRQGRQFSRLLAAEVCVSMVVMLDTLCSEVVWRVLATHYICQFPLHFPPPCVNVSHSHFNWTLTEDCRKIHNEELVTCTAHHILLGWQNLE